MNKFKSYSSARPWFMALLLSALAVGCGGGGGRDPILGTDGAGIIFVPPQGANVIIPGAACPVVSATIPTVIASDPTSGNQFATTSTNGVAGGGKLITATFSLALDPATINPTSFTLAPVGGAALVPTSVSYNAATNVATLTTSSALLAGTSYTAVIQGAVTSATGTPIGCNYVWNFRLTLNVARLQNPVFRHQINR
ncbi:Ig-like domain-containing protein [Polaromonas sp. P1(28)-13]|nr:Ig-like domain-containing protein [Polaromonas sp. P1(28)-13]